MNTLGAILSISVGFFGIVNSIINLLKTKNLKQKGIKLQAEIIKIEDGIDGSLSAIFEFTTLDGLIEKGKIESADYYFIGQKIDVFVDKNNSKKYVVIDKYSANFPSILAIFTYLIFIVFGIYMFVYKIEIPTW
jgi:hypothetical protein